MRKILNIVMMLAAALTLSSCSVDQDSSFGDMGLGGEAYIIDYGTVLITDGYGSSSNNYIIRDDGIALYIIRDYNYMVGTTLNNGDRVLINYNVIGDLAPTQLPESCKAGYAIQLNMLLILPCQQTIIGQEPDTECSPVVVSSMHIGKRHLDLRLDYKSLSGQKHEFKLFCPEPEAEGEFLDLYLVHYGDNDKNDDGTMISSHRISFDIAPLCSDQTRKIRLHWVDITGAKRGHAGDLNTWP